MSNVAENKATYCFITSIRQILNIMWDSSGSDSIDLRQRYSR